MLIAILRAVGFIGHYDNVASGRECRIAFFKFLNGGKDDSSTLAVEQQIDEVITALCVDGFLTKEVLTSAKLAIELVVEVFAVGHHYDGNFGQSLHQLVGIEYHREALARTLRVPKHTNFSVTFHCCIGALHGFPYGIILMVGSKNLGVFTLVLVEADIVL